MYRKVILAVLCTLMVGGCAAGCWQGGGDSSSNSSSPSSESSVTAYEVKFYDYTGIHLIHTQRVNAGDTLVYDGPQPETPTESGFEFAFAGWSANIDGDVLDSVTVNGGMKLYAVFTKTPVAARQVAIPAEDTTVYKYTGEFIKYNIPESDDYQIYNANQKDADTYSVIVDLKDKVNTCWADGTTDALTYEFVIQKADNGWTDELSIDGWEIGQEENAPTAASKFGQVTYAYASSENGEYTSQAPTTAGTWYVKATVEGTANYAGLSKTVSFVIDKNTFTVSFYNGAGEFIKSVEVLKNQPITYEGTLDYQTEQYVYAFEGWSESQGGAVVSSPVADGPKSLYAVMERTTRKYQVNFVDTDGGVLYGDEFEYGATPVYAGATIDEIGSGIIVKQFLGWGLQTEDQVLSALPTVNGAATYQAKYSTEFSSAYGDSESNPYSLTTKEEVIFLAQKVNGGQSFENKYFVLANDLDFTSSAWVAIGKENKPFAGNFDGNNKTLSVKVDDTTLSYAGVFGNNAGAVKNLKVAVSITAKDNVGGVVGYNTGSVSGCSVTGSLTGENNVGGVVGLNAGNVSLCSVDGAVKNKDGYMASAVGTGVGLIVGGTASGHAITLAPSVWDGSTATAFTVGDGSKTNPYQISTAEHLAYIKDNCASNSYYSGVYFKLVNSIDLGGYAWAGIGGGQSNSAFAGVLDGNGYTIYGVNIQAGTASRKGFFNSLSGDLLGLTVVGSISGTSENATYLGLMVGINYATIENCNVIGTMDIKGYHSGLAIGTNMGKDITNVKAYGSVTATKAFAGVLGYNFKSGSIIGTITACENYAKVTTGDFALANSNGVGGVIGLTGTGATIQNCINYGDVVGTAGANGGVAGIVGNSFASTIIGCYNYGDVTGGVLAGGIVGYNRQGGVVGLADEGEGTEKVFKGNANYGVVSAYAFAVGTATTDVFGLGGIVGVNGSSAPVTNGLNYGKVIGGEGSEGGTGGVVGTSYAATISACYNYGFVNADRNVGGIIGYARPSCAVENSFNHGNITANYNNAGGVVGYLGSSSGETLATLVGSDNFGQVKVSSSAAGGVVGYVARGSVADCENNGLVTYAQGGKGVWIGGIVGMNGSNSPITNCTNKGEVIGKGSSEGGVGGIAGSNYGSTVSNCKNEGAVTGEAYLGGIVGYAQKAEGIVDGCENSGLVTSTLTSGAVNAGGILGYNQATVKNCVSNVAVAVGSSENCTMYGAIIGYDTAGEGKVFDNTDNTQN